MGLTLPGASKAPHPMAPASPIWASPIQLYHFHALLSFGYFSKPNHSQPSPHNG